MQVLYTDAKAKETNDASIVLKTGYNDIEFLLMADASSDLEELLVDSYDTLKVQILKVGHHGSNTSTSKYFLDAVKPELTVLSYGKDNSYKHPHSDVLQRLKSVGSKVYSTAESGTIIIKTDGKTYNVSAKEMIIPSTTETKPAETKPVETKPTQPEPTEPKATQTDFKNRTELRKVYPSGVAKGHPAYQSKMDRDIDGWACE